MRVFSSKLFIKFKLPSHGIVERQKARLVLLGHPTSKHQLFWHIRPSEIFNCLPYDSLSCARNCLAMKFYVKWAFLHVFLDKEIQKRLPDGLHPTEICVTFSAELTVCYKHRARGTSIWLTILRPPVSPLSLTRKVSFAIRHFFPLCTWLPMSTKF